MLCYNSSVRVYVCLLAFVKSTLHAHTFYRLPWFMSSVCAPSLCASHASLCASRASLLRSAGYYIRHDPFALLHNICWDLGKSQRQL